MLEEKGYFRACQILRGLVAQEGMPIYQVLMSDDDSYGSETTEVVSVHVLKEKAQEEARRLGIEAILSHMLWMVRNATSEQHWETIASFLKGETHELSEISFDNLMSGLNLKGTYMEDEEELRTHILTVFHQHLRDIGEQPTQEYYVSESRIR